MCVCVRVRVCLSVFPCTNIIILCPLLGNVGTYICAYIRTYVCMYISTHIRMYVRMHMYRTSLGNGSRKALTDVVQSDSLEDSLACSYHSTSGEVHRTRYAGMLTRKVTKSYDHGSFICLVHTSM